MKWLALTVLTACSVSSAGIFHDVDPEDLPNYRSCDVICDYDDDGGVSDCHLVEVIEV